MVGGQFGAWRPDVRDLPGTVAGLFRMLPGPVTATAVAVADGCRAALTPHGLRRALDLAEPVLVGAAQRAGAGAPEMLAVLVAVKMVQQVLRHVAEQN
ncbi:hypothetical protein [Gandjariella thermophila]|uniref:Uncharacterized protein n=1 Tax=Gandjariella thermophila TaxID=1931992 RepID=A0A4D4J2P3_9PSEU|nr:hypothetical protein [Gandjariella thermophila]GDY29058.1 hypothetical protein GTS_06910 [Gandjariella thermophila]